MCQAPRDSDAGSSSVLARLSPDFALDLAAVADAGLFRYRAMYVYYIWRYRLVHSFMMRTYMHAHRYPSRCKPTYMHSYTA